MRGNSRYLLVVVCMAGLGVTACSSSSTSESSSSEAPAATSAAPEASPPESPAASSGELSQEAKDALYQVIIPVSATFTEANLKGARDEASALGLTNVQEVSSDADPQKMVAQIDDAISKGVKGMVLNPINSEAAGPALEKAVDAGMCVSIVYSNVLGAPLNEVAPGMKAFLGWDETQGGTALAKAVAEKMGGQGKVVVDGGIAANLGQQLRTKAVQETLATYPDIEVLGVQNSDSDPAKARAMMQNWIQSFGDEITGAIFIDDNTAASAVKVIENSPLKGNVVVGGFGGNAEFAADIASGSGYATIPFVPASDYEAALRLTAECVNGDRDPVLALTPTLDVMKPFASTDYVITSDNVSQFTPQW